VSSRSRATRTDVIAAILPGGARTRERRAAGPGRPLDSRPPTQAWSRGRRARRRADGDPAPCDRPSATTGSTSSSAPAG
jgi:hypothetical protein